MKGRAFAINRWRYLALAAAVALIASIALSVPQASASKPAGAPVTQPSSFAYQQVNDGLDKLPVGEQGLSYSTLAHMGRVHMPASNPYQGKPDPSWRNP